MDYEEERAAIRAAWTRGQRALEARDWKTYSDLWADVEYAQLLHPDKPEWLSGWEEFAPSYRRLLSEGPSIATRTRDMRINVAPSGDMAWATLKADLSFTDGSGDVKRTFWETVVFEKLDGQWKLVHGHVSQPVDGDN